MNGLEYRLMSWLQHCTALHSTSLGRAGPIQRVPRAMTQTLYRRSSYCSVCTSPCCCRGMYRTLVETHLLYFSQPQASQQYTGVYRYTNEYQYRQTVYWCSLRHCWYSWNVINCSTDEKLCWYTGQYCWYVCKRTFMSQPLDAGSGKGQGSSVACEFVTTTW